MECLFCRKIMIWRHLGKWRKRCSISVLVRNPSTALPQWKTPRYPSHRRLGRSQSWSACANPARNRSRVVRFVASNYGDWTISANSNGDRRRNNDDHDNNNNNNTQEVLGRTNRQLSFYTTMDAHITTSPRILRCRGKVFTELLPINDSGIHRQPLPW
jgi:hypothetical protein